MFALILPVQNNEADVMSDNHIKEKNDKIAAEWGSGWLSAKMLLKSKNKNFLESLKVMTEGEIITPDVGSSIPKDLLLQKKRQRISEKAKEELKKEVQTEQNKKLLKSKNLEDITDDSESDDDSTKCSSANNIVKDNELTSRENYLCQKNNTRRLNTKEPRTCICSQLPAVTLDQIQKLKQILALANSIKFAKTTLQNPTPDGAELQYRVGAYENNSSNGVTSTMELIKGSGIIVNTWKVDIIQNTYKKNPREMTRKLMKLILGDETLKQSSPTGKNHWKPIPEHIFIAVEKFVNAHVAKKKYTLSHQEYRQVLTAYCASLRNAKTKASDVKAKGKIFQNIKRELNYNEENFMETEESGVKENDCEKNKEKEIMNEDEETLKTQYNRKEQRKEPTVQEKPELREKIKTYSSKKRQVEENKKAGEGGSRFKPKKLKY